MAVIYKPGKEPENIQRRLNTLFAKLDAAYPDKVICGLGREHKKWAETVTELYRILGYKDNESFLNAYGYTLLRVAGGRPTSTDANAIIEELKKRYPNGSGFLKIDDLFDANPDLAPKKKTLMNTSKEKFGMTLAQYLKSIGILKAIEETLEDKVEELKRRYADGKPIPKTLTQLKEENADIPSISALAALVTKKYPDKSPLEFFQEQGLIRAAGYVCTVQIPGLKKPYYALTPYTTISVGECVEFEIGYDKLSVIATVLKVDDLNDIELPLPESELPVVKETVGVRKYNSAILRSALSVNAVCTVGALLESSANYFGAAKCVDTDGAFFKGKHATIASCRGLATEVVKAMTYLTEKDEQVYSYSDIVLVGTGVAEFAIFGNDVDDIIKRFPNLKVAVFAEESSSQKVYVGYSECGANGITVSQVAGSYKDNDTRRWSKMHAPSEKSFAVNNSDIAKYEFPYLDEWKKMDFLYSYAGKTIILGGK